jgi:hypothetical protein
MRKLEHILPAWANHDVGALGARLFSALGGEGGRRDARHAKSSETLTLVASVSDVGYRLVMLDRSGAVVSDTRRWLCVDAAAAGPAEALAHAAASAPRGIPLLEESIGAVALLIDDPQLHLTDHRAARLNNYEPRALRQFGVQQAGGRAVVFSSRLYGETGEREMERRVIAYLPEDRLEALFFPLGARAAALKSVAPAAAAAFDAPGEAVMALRVHGYFSTITLATPQSGVITSRQIPLGALNAASAYAAAFGLTLDQACAAMQERTRFAPPEAALADVVSPEYATASFAALAPFLRSFHTEIEATLDYYQFERYADRPGQLALSFTGPALAGLDHWLGEALDMPVVTPPDAPAETLAGEQPMNLLGNVRPGLLKVGAEPFQFENGGFRPADSVRGRRSAGRPGAGPRAAESKRARLAGLLSGGGKDEDAAPGVTARFAPLAMACAIPVLLAVVNLNFLIAPAQRTLDSRAAAYASLLGAPVAAGAPAVVAPSASGGSWAQNFVSLGRALLPGMQVDSVRLTAGDSDNAAQALEIDGVLPEAAAGDLRLVAGFIDRLGTDVAFAREFPLVEFAGLAAPRDEQQTGAAFRVIAAREGGE